MPKAKRNRKQTPDRMSGEYQRAVGEFVHREVYYCASMLIHELAQKPDYMDELLPVLSQDDYESAGREEGWDGPEPDKFRAPTFTNKDGSTWCAGSWEELCNAHNIEPHRTDAYEHWIISDFLADKLEAHGEMVLRDFLGLTLWGRTTTGQAIAMDGVICNIYDEMMG